MPTDVASARDLAIDLAIRYGFQVLGALVLLERFRTERIGVTPVLPALPLIPAEERSPWSS